MAARHREVPLRVEDFGKMEEAEETVFGPLVILETEDEILVVRTADVVLPVVESLDEGQADSEAAASGVTVVMAGTVVASFDSFDVPDSLEAPASAREPDLALDPQLVVEPERAVERDLSMESDFAIQIDVAVNLESVVGHDLAVECGSAMESDSAVWPVVCGSPAMWDSPVVPESGPETEPMLDRPTVMEETDPTTEQNPHLDPPTSDDTFIHFTQGEWELFDNAENTLNFSTVEQMFTLPLSPGRPISTNNSVPNLRPETESRIFDDTDTALVQTGLLCTGPDSSSSHTLIDTSATSESDDTMRVSETGTHTYSLSSQTSQSYDSYRSVSSNSSSLCWHDGSFPGQPTGPNKSSVTASQASAKCNQIAKQPNGAGETFSGVEQGQASFVKNAKSLMPERASCTESSEEFLTSSGVGQQQAHSSAKCEANAQAKQRIYKCTECGEIFHDDNKFVDHCKIHLGEELPDNTQYSAFLSPSDNALLVQTTLCRERPHECTECGNYFSSHLNLMRHRILHLVSKPYKCADCGRYFNKKSLLTQHLYTHANVKPVECRLCGKIFSTRDTVLQHQKIHSGIKPFKCDFCVKTYFCEDELMIHQATHNGEKLYACNNCGELYKQSHGKLCESNRHQVYECRMCKSTSSCEKCQTNNENSHREVKSYRCDKCGENFSGEEVLASHKKCHIKNKYVCEECGKVFYQTSFFKLHKRSHEAKLHECTQCQKTFSSETLLTQHKETHSKKPDQWSTCKATLPSKDAHTKHQKSHHVEKSSVRNDSSLLQSGHSNVELLECAQCEKMFRCKDLLAQHQKIHKRERQQHKCSTCWEIFPNKDALATHQQSHMVEKLYFCEKCGKCFDHSSQLKIHNRKRHRFYKAFQSEPNA